MDDEQPLTLPSPAGEGNLPVVMPFGEVPVGERFKYQGVEFTKEALSMAHDTEKGWGHVFMSELQVELDHEPATRLPWKPDEIYWADRISPAPGQRRKLRVEG